MSALVLNHEGFSGTAEGPHIDDLKDWVSLQDVPVPRPEGRQVLVRIGLANVNPADLHFIKGEYGLPRCKGATGGMEAMGTVVAAGDDEAARKLVGARGTVLAARGGTGVWADYALADAGSVIPLADGVRDEDGAALFVNPMTAWAMLRDAKAEGAGAVILTAGASQLGKLMASLAREMDLHTIATIRREDHRSPLEGLGVDTVLNTARADFEAMMVQAMKMHRPTVLLDAVADRASADLFAAMPPGAHWIVYGKLSPEVPDLPTMGQLIFMQKRIGGFWLSEWMARVDEATRGQAFAAVQKRFTSGEWRTDVAETVPLREAPDRLAPALDGMNRGKVFLKPAG